MHSFTEVRNSESHMQTSTDHIAHVSISPSKIYRGGKVYRQRPVSFQMPVDSYSFQGTVHPDL